MNVGDLVAGMEVLWIGPSLNRSGARDVAVRYQCCGAEITMKKKTVHTRTMQGKTLCHKCQRKAGYVRGTPPLSFATGPMWPVPPSVFHR